MTLRSAPVCFSVVPLRLPGNRRVSSRIRLKSLAIVSRSLSTLLESGVDVRKAFPLAGGRTTDGRCRRALDRVSADIARGEDVAGALRAQDGAFPPLFVDMVEVAERSGALPEVLAHLADHYDNMVRLRRNFLGQITWPVIQLNAAILLVALVLFVLGMIAQMQKGPALDVFGLGLTGTDGAIRWLLYCYGTLAGLAIAYRLVSGAMTGRMVLDPLLMKVPVLGTCLRSFAIARFSWAFALTQEAGMPLEASLDSSTRATGNGKFLGTSRFLRDSVRDGATLFEAFSESGLFPPDYLEMVHVGESSGTVPEMLRRMGPRFEEDARRALSVLASMLGWLIWLIVAGFILFFIIRFMLWYVDLINEAVRATR